MRKSTTASVVALGLALTACGSGSGTGSDAGPSVEGNASPPAAASAEVIEAATTPVATDASPTPAATGTAAPARGANNLTLYLEKYPFDKVGGVTWDDHPMVVAGIRKTVTDAAARRAIETVSGPSAPIGLYQGKVGAWSCEQHNCGDHQWAVMVDPKSGATDVCYYNAAQVAGSSRWFLADGREETRTGDCSVV